MWDFMSNLIWGTPNDLPDHDLLTELGVDIEDNIEEIATKDGTITQLFQEYGMIDDEFYFPRSMTPKICERPLQTGDQIQFKCSRKNANQQWKVTEILLLYGRDQQWMEENNVQAENPVHSRDVGKVVRVENDIIFIEVQGEDFTEELEFQRRHLDFQPYEEDLLVLDVALRSTCLDDLKEAQILSASALRKQHLPNSMVTSWWPNLKKGIIDGNVFFTDLSFSNPAYVPKLNDQVRIEAVECEPSTKTRNCNWRAISLVLNSTNAGCESQTGVTNLDRDLLRDKFGVHVEDVIDFGPIPANQPVAKTILVKNYDKHERSVVLTGIDFQATESPIQIDSKFPIVLPANKSILINVTCLSQAYGSTQILTLINLENDQGIRSKIGTLIKLEIRDELMDQMQIQMKPFVQRFQNQLYQRCAKAEHVIKAPKKKSNIFVKKRLGFYPVPKNVEAAYYQDDNDLADSFPVLGHALTMSNYKDKFSKLIYLEELENTEIMSQYSLCSVVFQRHGPYLSLEVPGLAEKRPSLALGDIAIVRQYNQQEAFEGKNPKLDKKALVE